MAQWVRVVTPLPEDPDPNPTIHKEAHHCLYAAPVPGILKFSHRYTFRQKKSVHISFKVGKRKSF